MSRVPNRKQFDAETSPARLFQCRRMGAADRNKCVQPQSESFRIALFQEAADAAAPLDAVLVFNLARQVAR